MFIYLHIFLYKKFFIGKELSRIIPFMKYIENTLQIYIIL